MKDTDAMHILRNPWGHSDDDVRAARLWAGDEIERLRALLRLAETHVYIPDDCDATDAIRVRIKALAFLALTAPPRPAPRRARHRLHSRP